MEKEMIHFRNIILAKAFKAEEGTALAVEINQATPVAGRRVVIIDHPPTQGLFPLLEALVAAGAEVHLRDHHADADRDGSTVAACRALLGERAVVTTRAEHPACSTLVGVGEFADAVIVGDADQDGLTAALKAAGVWYPEGDTDAAVLDGPATGKTKEALSPLGFALVRAWGAIPAFGDRNRDAVVTQVATAFAAAVSGDTAGQEVLDRFAVEYEKKVASAKALATTATEPFAGFRIVLVPQGTEYDGPTLATELDRDVLVSARVVTSGPIAGKPGGFGSQVSLARTRAGEQAGIDLAALVPSDWGRGPEAGCISNTPFLLHLSPDKWEVFAKMLEKAVKG